MPHGKPAYRTLAILFLFALAVRVPLLVSLHDTYLSGGITTSLGLVARNLLAGRGLVETTGPGEILHLYDWQLAEGKLLDIERFPDPPDPPTKPLVQRMPGYPLLLAAFWRVTGSLRYLPVQILQVLVSAMLPLLLYGAGRRLLGEPAGLTAGVLAALHVPEARLAVVPLYDAWIVFFAGLLIWIVVRSSVRGYPLLDFVGIGFGTAVAVWFKPTVLPIPALLAAALLPRVPPRQALLRGVVALGIPLLALVPWAVRNEHLFGRPILTTTFLWPSVWEGFGEVPNPFGAILDDRNTYRQAVAENPRLVYGTPEYDDHFRPKVLEIFGSRPGFVAGLWARRLVRGLLFPENSWGIAAAEAPGRSFTEFRRRTGGGILAYAAADPLAAAARLSRRVWEPLLFALAALALYVDRHRWRDFLPVLSIPAGFLATTLPIHLEGRYLLPGSLVWILFASVPLSVWGGSLLSSRTRRPSGAVAL
jgi:4-amino-4-deoxy-L-arabinose transferase-like glycosyltransferase